MAERSPRAYAARRSSWHPTSRPSRSCVLSCAPAVGRRLPPRARPMPDEMREPPPDPSEHLRIVRGSGRWIRALAPAGLLLLACVVVVTLAARSALWFLVYPVLVLGALAALATAVAW